MKKLMLIFPLLIYSSILICQSIERQVIANGGAYITNGTQTFNQTFGQTVTSILQGNGPELYQGFQNPENNIGTSTENFIEPMHTIKINPNPNAGKFSIVMQPAYQGEVEISIYDVLGHLILVQIENADNLSRGDFNLKTNQSIPNGTYTIILRTKNKNVLGSRKIIFQK